MHSSNSATSRSGAGLSAATYCDWLALAALLLVLLCLIHGVRPDLSMRLQQRFLLWHWRNCDDRAGGVGVLQVNLRRNPGAGGLAAHDRRWQV